MIHHLLHDNPAKLGCDLLSNLYFCIGWYTCCRSLLSVEGVVICFQICIFVLGDTPSWLIIVSVYWLWFAFKFVFLYWVIHPIKTYSACQGCCDLLSNLYFCIGWYTTYFSFSDSSVVVICFQICIFVLGDTPNTSVSPTSIALWFAFKFVFLYWVIHQGRTCNPSRAGCDLLSNLYFCIGWYTTIVEISSNTRSCEVF